MGMETTRVGEAVGREQKTVTVHGLHLGGWKFVKKMAREAELAVVLEVQEENDAPCPPAVQEILHWGGAGVCLGATQVGQVGWPRALLHDVMLAERKRNQIPT